MSMGSTGRRKGSVRRSVIARPFFRKFLDSHVVTAPSGLSVLPLSHGTKAIFLRDILAAGEIALPLEPCQTLGKQLIFTFYGRPSYRVNPHSGAIKRPAGAPTYLLLKPKALDAAVFAHPLDTGAFDVKIYENHIEQALNAVDFGFDATIGNIHKVITYFFGTNDGYMNNSIRNSINIPDGYDEAQAYYDIISGEGAGDDRNSAIEIALNQRIPIDPEWVQCVVMPSVLIDAEDYGARLKALNIDVRIYRFQPGLSPANYTSHIFDVVLDYYRTRNFL